MNEQEIKGVRAQDYFTIRAVDAESDKRVVTIGNRLASPILFDNEVEAQKAIDEKDWDLILSLIFAACDAREIAKTDVNERKRQED